MRTEHLVKRYGAPGSATEVTALDDVSLGIEEGRLTAIMGPSGSGKSTLMHVAAGLDAATAGRAWIGDTEITALSDDALTKLRRRDVGFVFQAFNLLPTLTARDNILLPAKLAGRSSAVDKEWLEHVIHVLGLSDRLAHHPSELSGGQQQRVAIARALVARPKVIFADEPTGALDSAASTALLEFLRRSVTELGQSIVVVTHDAGVASYADRVITLGDGRVVADDVRRHTGGPLTPAFGG